MSDRSIGRAVVTGAAGFIGSHLTEALLERGCRVLGIDCFSPYYPPVLKHGNLTRIASHPRFELLSGDVNELDLEEVVRPGDVVFHLAGQPGVRASWGPAFADYSRNNLDATHSLLEAARRHAVARVILASSSSVYGDAPLPMVEDGPVRPVSPYGLTKLAAEQLALLYGRSFGVEVVPLRFFTVYGPRQRPDMAFSLFIEAILARHSVPVHGSGEQVRDFTYVADVVQALLAAAERAAPGEPINVGGGSPVSVLQTIAILENLLGRHAELEYTPSAAGDTRDTLADYSRLDALGVVPHTGIEDGLRRQVEWRLESQPLPRVRGARPVGRDDVPPTYLLYSHDTYGLGHLRRNTAIARAVVSAREHVRVVLITGSPVAAGWPLPPGVEIIQLPPAVKVGAESYRPVDNRSMAGLLAERAGIISSALIRLRPDAFLVDHSPLGLKGELRLVLEVARGHLPETRVLLGLRDILDEPAEVRRVWAEQRVLDWIENCYDHVLVYGLRELFDVGDAYGFNAEVAARTRYTGYVNKDAGLEPVIEGTQAWQHARRPGDRRILVTGGGGGDAAPLFLAFLEAWPRIKSQLPARALMVTGPLMNEETRSQLEAAVGEQTGVQLVHSSKSMLRLVEAADLVVSMGGYNSVVEAVAARKRLVICPRVRPRREQLIRGQIFARLGLAACVDPDELGPAGLAQPVTAAIATPTPPPEAWAKVDLRGGERTAASLIWPAEALKAG